MRRIVSTPENVDQWEELYKQGKSLQEIAKQFGCDLTTVYQALRKRGVKFRSRLSPVMNKEVDLWVRAYLQSGDLNEVVTLSGRRPFTVLSHMVRRMRELLLTGSNG